MPRIKLPVDEEEYELWVEICRNELNKPSERAKEVSAKIRSYVKSKYTQHLGRLRSKDNKQVLILSKLPQLLKEAHDDANHVIRSFQK